jgi:dipeptidyl aminopeptidase/acylaminoacyl peptidase
MKPADLTALISLGQPAVSPDGRTVAFVVTRADEEDNDYHSQIWLVATSGGSPPLPFTSGEHKDANPTWSPDGTRLAFTSTRGTGDKVAASIHVAPVRTGGATVRLARLRDAASDLRWSPDGRQIAFTARTRAERLDDADERKQPPRRVTRLFTRLDNVGFTVDRPQHVYVVAADGSTPARNLTLGDHEFSDPCWTSDSSTLLVSAATHDGWDLDLRVDIQAIDVASADVTRLTSTRGAYNRPSASPDGSRVALHGTDDVDSYPHNIHVALLDRAGGDHTWISTALDRTFAPFPGARAPHWLDDSTLLVAVEDRGNDHLYRLSVDGSLDPVWTGEGCVTAYDEAAGTIAFTVSTATLPAELHVQDAGGTRRLTDLTSGFAARARLRPYQRLTVPSTDGSVELDAWILNPPDLDPQASYPMLLNVHGGPFGQYTNGFFDEVQVQARAGFVVVWCNPRGSSGREEEFGRAICGKPLGGTGWGSVDLDDVLAVADHATTSYPWIDAGRVGILGGSYGGYLTSWAIGHTDRFKAACAERGCYDMLTMEGVSDAAGAFRTWIGATHLEAPELYVEMSPIAHAREIATPLLLIHSENDLRCPIGQADQMFVTMRMLGKEVELVRFPGESHELSRSGSPAHRRQRAEIILEFFGRHLAP